MPPDNDAPPAPDAAPPGAPAAPAAASTPPAAPPAAAPAPGAPANIFDAAASSDTPPAKTDGKAEGKVARPDHIPEQFWDVEKGEPRIEQMAKSWQDMRARVSRGEGTLPEAPDGYVLPAVEGVPDNLVSKDDPLWVDIRGAAHKLGVTQAQLDGLVKPYMSHFAKVMAENAPPDAAKQEAEQLADLRVELGKLGSNGVHMVKELGGWISGMEARGALTADEAGALKDIGSAAGIRAIIKLRGLGGEHPIPLDALVDGEMTQAEAQHLITEGFAKGDDAMRAKGRRALEALQKRGLLKLP